MKSSEGSLNVTPSLTTKKTNLAQRLFIQKGVLEIETYKRKDMEKQESFIERMKKMMPRQNFERKDGFVILNPEIKELLSKDTYTPNAHLIAVSTTEGLKCISVSTENDRLLYYKIEELEKEHEIFPYRYLGITDNQGKIVWE